MKTQNYLLVILGVCLASGISSNSYAAYLAIIEQNASYLGNAYAGKSATAEDASTAYYNPAGLVKLSQQELVLSGVGVLPHLRPTINSATNFIGQPLSVQPQTINSVGKDAVVPSFYLGGPLSNCWYYGISVTENFGLATDYPKDSLARYAGTLSKLTSIDINPNLAWKINPYFSLGIGISAQYLTAKLNRQLDLAGELCASNPLACLLVEPGNPNFDGDFRNKVHDWAVGFNLGALVEFDCDTRIGLSYRSAITHHFKGKAQITYPQALPNVLADALKEAGLVDQEVHGNLPLPDLLSLSSYHRLDANWAVVGDITFTNWSRIKTIAFNYDKLGTEVDTENLRNTLRYSLGSNYYCNNFTFKFGLAYDVSPDRAEFRKTRLPDADRFWLALGIKYAINHLGYLDLGYAHLFMPDANVKQTISPSVREFVSAHYKLSSDLIGLQLTCLI